MSGKTILEIPLVEQEQMLAHLRAARYGYLLSIHILLLCAQGHTPSEIATFLLCSRSSVYRTVETYRRGEVAWNGVSDSQARALLSWQRSLLALLKRAPSACGWCRTRWSCQTLAVEIKARRGLRVSRETRRPHLAQLGLCLEASAARGS